MRCLLAFVVLGAVACGPPSQRAGDGGGGDDGDDDPTCARSCSADLQSVVDCNGDVVQECQGTTGCDAITLSCVDACAAAATNGRSVGCNYYATDMQTQSSSQVNCFAAFVANTWPTPAKINVKYKGVTLDAATFTRIPSGQGASITYAPYDPNVGVPSGEVAILFLSGNQGPAPFCPVPTATSEPGLEGTLISNSFEITTDVPVVAYQINPYGGGSVAVTAASLLLPTSAWDTNYVAVNVSPNAAGMPSMNIVAREPTTVTLTPNVAVTGGTISGPAGQPITINLAAGEQAQVTQPQELTGSTITSTAPVGLMAGQTCMNVPVGTPYCDHGEQMIPPVKALGSRYVGVMYRPRVPAETFTTWRMVGAVDGTQLVFTPPIPGAPTTLAAGQAVTFDTGTPFVVTSQDADHPFLLATYMRGSMAVAEGHGDPDFVLSVPPEQYLSQYVFFTDPTYPETNLVFVRARGSDGNFKDVTLDCLGAITGWTAVGDYEYARVDLSTGDFANVGACGNGRHEATSDAPFGLWVWGWGTPNTSIFTANVSYGYPGGMNVQRINNVIL